MSQNDSHELTLAQEQADGTNVRILDTLQAESIRLLAGSIAYFYVLMMVAHLIFLPGNQARIMSALAGFSALVSGLVFLAYRNRNPAPALAHPLAFMLGIVTAANPAVQLVVTGDMQQSVFMVVTIIAAGCVMFSLRWLVALGLTEFALWFAALRVGGLNTSGNGEYFMFLAGALIAVVVLVARARVFLRLENLRMQDHMLRKELEHALAVSEGSFRRLADNSKDVIFRTQYLPEFKQLYISPSVVDMMGYTPAEYYADATLGRRIVHPDDLIKMQMAIAERTVKSVVVRCFRKDGRMIWMEQRPVPILENDSIIGVEGICRDVTEEITAAAALRTSETRLRTALSAASMGIWEWDIAAQHIAFSDGVAALFGVDPSVLPGDPESLYKLTGADASAGLRDAVKALLAGGAPFLIEHSVIRPDGQTRWLRAQGEVIRDESGRPVRVLGAVLDITSQKESERALWEAKERAEAASRVKNSILANMSHEIRTPMTAILGYSDLMVHTASEERTKKFANIIKQGGNRLMHLLDSIIDVARIEADRVTFAPTAHALRDTVEQVTAMMRVLAEKKGLKVELDIAPDIFVNTDAHYEAQLLTNILGNSIRFTESGGIRVWAEGATLEQKKVTLFIRDTGIGIGAEFLPHIFDEFRQESEGFSRTHEGSGLGLSIAKKLIERMNGSLRIESVRGEGTLVSIELPAAEAPGLVRGADPVAVIASPEIATGRSLLIVEDDPACGDLICRLFSPAYDVVWVTSGVDAVLAAQGRLFHAVLIDISLSGGIDGVEAMQRLRRLAGYEALPMVALTAYAMAGDAERFIRAGFDHYVSKPFEPRLFRQLIDEQLANRKLQ